MIIYMRRWFASLAEVFWVLPGIMVFVGIIGAVASIAIDRSGLISPMILQSYWVYDGGGTGARTLLGAIASSTIGVAGTVFSITIAALSLAAGQMGPRLLRNFVKDRGNQVTLGTFLGTFSFCLIVLRSVRTQAEGAFVPHLSLSIAIFLAIFSVATLVYFVGHMAGRINVDVVIELVAEDVRDAIDRLTSREPEDPQSLEPDSSGMKVVTDARHGYLQEIDQVALVDWAVSRGCVIKLLVKPGSYVFPHAPIALVSGVTTETPPFASALRIGGRRVDSADLEFAVRHLVEVAVRALSPGINDPHTAISVLDRLGVALCHLATLSLPIATVSSGGTVALVVPVVDYDGLTDTMFHLIRQNAQSSTGVLIRLLEVLTVVASCDRDPKRLTTLLRHADLVLEDATRTVANVSDLDDIHGRHHRFARMKTMGATGYWG